MCNVHRFWIANRSGSSRTWCAPCAHANSCPILFNILIFRCFLNWDRSMEAVGLRGCDSFCASAFERRFAQQTRLGKLSNAAYSVGSFGAFKSDAASGPG